MVLFQLLTTTPFPVPKAVAPKVTKDSKRGDF